jgi:hypothetical protein
METNSHFADAVSAMKQQKKCEAELEVALELARTTKEAFTVFFKSILARAAESYNKLSSVNLDNKVYTLVTDNIAPTIDWEKETFTIVVRVRGKNKKEPFVQLDRLVHSPTDIFWNLVSAITEELEKENIPLTCLGIDFPFSYYSF